MLAIQFEELFYRRAGSHSEDDLIAQSLLLVMLLPTFVLCKWLQSLTSVSGLMLMVAWYQFLLIALTKLCIISLYHYVFTRDPTYPYHLNWAPLSLVTYAAPQLAALVTVFTLFERANKERFVLSLTNEKTVKKLLQLIDNLENRAVVVSRQGKILFNNR